MGALRNRIIVAAQEAAATVANASPSGELERLAELHRTGALSDLEFSQAKARLLAS